VTFSALASSVATAAGRPEAFVAAAVVIVMALAAACVPGWRESANTWCGAITGYVSILLLVILQNSQNRDGLSLHAKLDELIRASTARNEFAGIDERLSEEALLELRHGATL